MTPEIIAIIAVGVALAGFMFTINLRLEHRIDRLEESVNQRFNRLEESVNQRFNRLEESTNQRFNRLEDDMKQRFDSMDARLRTLEQAQSHLAGEMATLREAILLQPAGRE